MDYLSIVLFFSFLWFCLTAIKRSRSKLPPGPFPLPIVGNLFSLSSQPHLSLAKLSSTYGPLMTLKLGNLTALVVSSPSMAKEFLQTHDQAFLGRNVPDSFRALDHHKYSMVWLPASPQWRSLRKLATMQLFTNQRLHANQGLRISKVNDLLAYVEECRKNKKAIHVAQVAFSTVLNFLSNAAFSRDLTNYESGPGQDFKHLMNELSVVTAKPNLADCFSLLRPLDLQGHRRSVARIFRKFDEVFDAVIKERLESRVTGTGKYSDFLETILQYRHEDGTEFSDKDKKATLKDIFAAGTHTTSVTVEWVMAELLKNPHTMRKVKLELQEKIGKDNPIDESNFEDLPYLKMVVKETFRMHPPVSFLVPHRAESQVEVANYIIPKNTLVLFNLWPIGRDPTIWENPDTFDPERFLNVNTDYRGQHFELLPFGSGRRMCPGFLLAYRMLHLMIASLLHAFDWSLEEGLKVEDLDMKENFGFTMQKATSLMALPLKNGSSSY